MLRKLRKVPGVEVTGPNGENHYTVRKGDVAISVAGTPSDVRWQKNLLADLRRAGIDLNHRTPREVAKDREVFMMDQLMARKYTTAELTKLLNDAGEKIGESGVRARLARMEGRGLVFRANGASQGKEVEWRARSAVPEMPSQAEVKQEAPALQLVHSSSNVHAEVSSSFDLANATAKLTISLEGPLGEILEKLTPLVRSGAAAS